MKAFDDKSFVDLGIDKARKFIVVNATATSGLYNNGDLVSFERLYNVDDMYAKFKLPNGNATLIDFKELAYADEENSCEFTRGERVMTENGERIFLTKIEGAESPYVVVAPRYEKEFNAGEEFHWGWTKECSKLPAVTEMTMEQVNAALGKKVKIVA